MIILNGLLILIEIMNLVLARGVWSMAENNTNSGMPETSIATLKEALCAQQQLLQKLYAELDVEKESSATAVSEALSMILHLQGVMEASQYKRMTEEEICHAEENLANI